MKYKITLNGKTYEVEVEAGQAMLVDEYEAYAPVSYTHLDVYKRQSHAC